MLGSHDVFTVSYMGWNGLKNGSLLRAAAEAGFEVLVTGDQTLSQEQNVSAHNIAVVVLSSIELRVVRNYLPAVIEAISTARTGTLTPVNCGHFTRSASGSG